MFCSVFVSVLLLYTAGGAVVDNQKKGKCSGVREEWRECGPKCQPTCDLLGEELCCEVEFHSGCFCVDSTIRDHKGRCVPINECPKPGVLTINQTEVVCLEGASVVTIPVTRMNGSRGRITVSWRVALPAPAPYSRMGGMLVFEDGELQQSIKIQVVDNDERNPDLVIEVELFEPSRKTSLVRDRTKLVIKDDDMRPGWLEMAEGGVSVPESVGEALIRVVRVGGTDGDLSVQWRVRGLTAKVGVDFVSPAPTNGKLSFAEGEAEKTIVIKIVDDEVRETREEFEVELFDPEAGPEVINFRNKGTRMKTFVHIDDDDMTPGYPEMANGKLTVTEGEKGRVTIRVVRRGGADGEISVRWRVVPGTAFPGLDYLFAVDEGKLVFAENVTEQWIVFRIVDDEVKEEKESFRVELFEPRPGPGVIKFRARGQLMTTDVVIIDDDREPGVLEFERSRHVISERVESLRVWVVRRGGTDGVVRVHWRTAVDREAPSLSRAEPGIDFKMDSGVLVFREGEERHNFSVHIVDDVNRENREESFLVELFGAESKTKGFKGLGEVTTTTIVIHDDDMRPGKLQFDEESSFLTVAEGVGVVRLRVERVGGDEGEVRVHYAVKEAEGGGAFFRPQVSELVFKEKETIKEIEVEVVDDLFRNMEERRFEVRLFDPTAGLGVVNFKGLGERTKAVVTVLDDDINPGILNLELSTFSVHEGMGVVRVSVARLNGSDGRVTAHFRTTPLTAKEGSDFVPSEGQLVFEDGVKLQFIDVTIVDDKVREDNEEFAVELVDFRGLVKNRQTVVTILDDDSNVGIFDFKDKHVEVSERAGVVTLWVVRRDGTDGRVQLKWRSTDGTARNDVDFASSGGGVLQFEDGELERSFSIPIIDSKGSRADRTFTVGLFDPRDGGRLGTNSLVTVTIHDEKDSTRIFFRNTTVHVFRGEPEVTLVVERVTDDLSRPLNVHFETLEGEGSAWPDFDFRRTKGRITFTPPTIAIRVRVLLIGQGRKRRDTPIWFKARISNPSEGAVVPGRDEVKVWIFDAPQVKDERIETTRDLEFRGKPLPKDITCPPGMTPNECAPACQGVCPGLDPVGCGPAQNGCVRGCFCPPGRLLDHTLRRCVLPSQCTTDPALPPPLPPNPNPPPPPPVVTLCPEGMTLRPCAPACQGVCPGLLEPVCRNQGGCVRGCFCPPGMLLDDSLTRCVLPSQCTTNPALPPPPPPPNPPPPPVVTTCPEGMTLRSCAPACQGVCPGLLEPVCRNQGGCVRGCFCPPGMLLDDTLSRCVLPDQCSSSGRDPVGSFGGGQLVGNFGNPPPGFQLKADVMVEGRGGVQLPPPQPQKPLPPPPQPGVCPAGLTFKACAPACQTTCPGLEPVCDHSARVGGCVKGCFCPVGQVLDHSLRACIPPSRCGGSERNAGGLTGGLPGGLGGGLGGGGGLLGGLLG